MLYAKAVPIICTGLYKALGIDELRAKTNSLEIHREIQAVGEQSRAVASSGEIFPKCSPESFNLFEKSPLYASNRGVIARFEHSAS